MLDLKVSCAPNGQGLVWGLGTGMPALFPDIYAAHRAVSSASNMSAVDALTPQHPSGLVGDQASNREA